MSGDLWAGTEVTAFLAEHEDSATHRRMFYLGQISVKVAGMFGGGVPPEARKAAALWLVGMQSGNAAIYDEANREALKHYHAWVARMKLS